MSANNDDIPVPRRAIYILIIVSLFINVFFLLMGILIGKDDLKWNKQPLVEVADKGQPLEAESEDSLENELLAFENETSENRGKPIDPGYMDEKQSFAQKPVPQQPREAERVPEQTRKASPSAERTQKASPPASRPTVAQSTSKPAPGIWIQILATKDRANADRFRAKVAGGGFRTIIVTISGMHKVRVGPYPDRLSANRDKKRIHDKFKVDGWIVTPN